MFFCPSLRVRSMYSEILHWEAALPDALATSQHVCHQRVDMLTSCLSLDGYKVIFFDFR